MDYFVKQIALEEVFKDGIKIGYSVTGIVNSQKGKTLTQSQTQERFQTIDQLIEFVKGFL